jgi:eukaryotic-like serine/threonine-protein kinase
MFAKSRKSEYDVFISYRRGDGAAEARLIQAALAKNGLRAFLDVTDLAKGHFEESLLKQIKETPNFIVVLSEHALDRCAEDGDFLRGEIACAIAAKRNIFPVMLPKFAFPEESKLPEDIRLLPRNNGVPYSHELFDGMIVRLVEMIRPRPLTAWQKTWRASKKHPGRVGLSVAMIAAAIVAVFWFAGTRPVLSFAPRDWILLTDFDNQTGEAVFDKTLLTALTVSLEQSARANVFPRALLPDTLKRMNKPVTQAIDETIGREICLRENIRGLLSCRISRVGREYVLSAQVLDPQSGISKRSYLERAKGQEEVLTALDKIASQLRRDLGESLSSIRMADRPLPQITTSSLEALKSFVDAGDLWAKGQYREAIQAYKIAVKLDEDFALAHASLGNAYSSFIVNQPVDGKAEYEKALQLSTRTTERERFFIELQYTDSLGHAEEANKLYKVYLERYPYDWVARANFASALRGGGQYQEAIEQGLELIRLAPRNANAYIGLATAYIGICNVEEALRYYNKAFELEPSWKTGGNLNHEYGFVLVSKGDEAEAEKVFEQALANPGTKGLPERSLGWLALYRGRYHAAKNHFEASLLAFKAIGNAQLSEGRTHVLLGIVAAGQGDRIGLLRNLAEAEEFIPKIQSKVWMGSLIGCLEARSGAREKAEKVLQIIKPVVDFENAEQSSQFHRLEGEIALARGRKNEAFEPFNLAQNEKPGPQTMEALARAYAAAGNVDQSIVWYQKLTECPITPLGWEVQQDSLIANYDLAKLYLAKGQKDKAAASLGKLLMLWKDADPDIPVLKQAKAEYAKLQ